MESNRRGPARSCHGSPWCLSAAYPRIPNGPYTPPGQPEQDRAAWAAVAPDADLRTLPYRLRENFSLGWIFVQERAHGYSDFRCFTLEPFQMGVPLGPLASVQVYASDPVGEEYDPRAYSSWASRKSHGLGCQHAPSLEPEWHRLQTLEEFHPLHPPPRGSADFSPFSPAGMAWNEQQNRWCSKCGGYVVRRFTDEACDYYTAQVAAFYEEEVRS